MDMDLDINTKGSTYRICFKKRQVETLFKLKQRVVNQWLDSAAGIRSDQVGLVVPFDSKIIVANMDFWELIKGKFNFHIHSYKNEDEDMKHVWEFPNDPGCRLYTKINFESSVIPRGRQLACFFKGDAFNPEIDLLLEIA